MRVKEMGLRGRTINSPKQPVYVGEVQYCPYCFLPLEGKENNPNCPRCRVEWLWCNALRNEGWNMWDLNYPNGWFYKCR